MSAAGRYQTADGSDGSQRSEKGQLHLPSACGAAPAAQITGCFPFQTLQQLLRLFKAVLDSAQPRFRDNNAAADLFGIGNQVTAQEKLRFSTKARRFLKASSAVGGTEAWT